jgi:hypothetical protein
MLIPARFYERFVSRWRPVSAWYLLAAVLLMTSPAFAGSSESLATIAKRDGFSALYAEIGPIIAKSKSDKKLQGLLEQRQLQSVRMPVKAILGSELVLKDPSPLGNCRYKDKIYCSIIVRDFVATKTKEHHFVCKSRFGTTLPLETAGARDQDGGLVWALSGLEKCWELGGTEILIKPISSMELEGIGEGSDFIPPELVQLDYHQVQDIIAKQMDSFRFCTQNAEESTGQGAGTLEIRYTIGEDGRVTSAEAGQALYDDQELIYCLVERFKRIKFPPPRGGYNEGTYPFTFSY